MGCAVADVLDRIATAARDADIFESVETGEERVKCRAPDAAESAWYCVGRHAGGWFVELVTHDRWLNESIEADLLHRGDPIEELLADELEEQGGDGPPPIVRHYRSDEMLYTYRTPLAVDDDTTSQVVEHAVRMLLAYEAVFRELGDMTSEDRRDQEE